MKKSKTRISNAAYLSDIADFWDTHSLSEYWEKTRETTFEIQLNSRQYIIEVDTDTSNSINLTAKKRGISNTALISEWVREKAKQSKTKTKSSHATK